MTYRYTRNSQTGRETWTNRQARRPRRSRRNAPAITVETDRVLNLAAATVREHGWVSSAQSDRDGVLSTAARVKAIILSGNDCKVTEADRQVAAAARAWAELQSGSEYADKIALLAHEDNRTVTDREIGLAASIVGSHLRQAQFAAERAARQERARNGSHVGTVGQRGEFILRLVKIRTVYTRFGESRLHRFEAADGGEVVWFATRGDGMAEGSTYKVRATVKQHGEYQGAPTTTINRAMVVEQVA
jgi:hypothetical protein